MLPFLSSCRDDDDDIRSVTSEPWIVTATGGSCVDDDGQVVLTRLAAYERLTVHIGGYDAERDGAVTVAVSTTDADKWLSVAGDTLATDGQLVLATEDNDTGVRRMATLVFTSVSDPSRSVGLAVTQLSASDDDSNGEDARAELFVGYGYDIYAALHNPMSVKTKRPIIDLKVLKDSAAKYDLDAIHDCRLQQFDVNVYAATTLQELANDMTASCSSSKAIDIQGCIATCKRLIDAAPNVSITENNVGYGVMTKTVASRTLDKGVMQYLRKIDSGKSNLIGLNQEFLKALTDIRSQSGAARETAVTQVLDEFGTHIVLQADLGGKLDYAFTMSKTESYHANTDANEEVRYTMGQLSKGDRTTGVTRVTSSKSMTEAIKIWGGSDQAVSTLRSDIARLDQEGQLPPGHVQEWLASIKYSDRLAMDKTLDVVHFELMPVWDLVPHDLRLDFLEATLKMASRSDCQLPASVLGTDIYEIDMTSTYPDNYRDLFDFSKECTPNIGSLCRLVYMEGEPVMEVCSEYVPKIRTDQRVTIVYPIHKKHIRMNQGLFYGDGVHQPAYVGFSNGDCYVNPIDTLAAGTIIKKFWYVNGNLLLKNPTRDKKLTSKNCTIQEDFLPLYTDDGDTYKGYRGPVKHRHPLVKIGSKFWTRRDIDHRLLFAENQYKAGVDQIKNQVCYTQFMWEQNNTAFTAYNGWIWGDSPNTFYPNNPNTKWFLPTPQDVDDLYKYIGFNPKALFKDQLSGWDAEFNGYYGNIDILNSNRYFSGGQRELRYVGELNAISSKNSNSYSEACVLLLHPDYSITMVNNMRPNNQWRLNFYPVRPVRGFMFNYPTTNDINSYFTRRTGRLY